MPVVVRRLIAVGVRPPSHFGSAEVAQYFPGSRWRVLADGPTEMHGVPLRPGGSLQRIPSYFVVLRALAYTQETDNDGASSTEGRA